ncbi:hypothetical protein C7M84_021145 [Penaeus vannamei]|uniref:Uncharacterized protein n=1 Tax=Penaeus vannamei TaxID=6689 RepID=A0A3R7NL28_PENVA|nr:hypothetical protein C7M84_021145 [Penaeus vannamei]
MTFPGTSCREGRETRCRALLWGVVVTTPSHHPITTPNHHPNQSPSHHPKSQTPPTPSTTPSHHPKSPPQVTTPVTPHHHPKSPPQVTTPNPPPKSPPQVQVTTPSHHPKSPPQSPPPSPPPQVTTRSPPQVTTPSPPQITHPSHHKSTRVHHPKSPPKSPPRVTTQVHHPSHHPKSPPQVTTPSHHPKSPPQITTPNHHPKSPPQITTPNHHPKSPPQTLFLSLSSFFSLFNSPHLFITCSLTILLLFLHSSFLLIFQSSLFAFFLPSISYPSPSILFLLLPSIHIPFTLSPLLIPSPPFSLIASHHPISTTNYSITPSLYPAYPLRPTSPNRAPPQCAVPQLFSRATSCLWRHTLPTIHHNPPAPPSHAFPLTLPSQLTPEPRLICLLQGRAWQRVVEIAANGSTKWVTAHRCRDSFGSSRLSWMLVVGLVQDGGRLKSSVMCRG